MKKIILILGAILTILLAFLWYYNIISEPLVAVGSGILTIISLIFIPENKNNEKKVKIIQRHSGKGDNVGGNKTIKK